MNFSELYNEIKDEIISVRRSIHMKPETAFEEYETAKTICEFLKKHSIEYTENIAQTGICATVGDKAKNAVLIRADMDALPIKEQTCLEFASKNDGIMHACGHDIHIATALATAYVLKKIEDKLDICVKFVFQPAEETTGGAKIMINEGVMENPRVLAALGGHVTAEISTGKVWLKTGALMASPDDFKVTFIGKSCHGATPELGISPLMPASEFSLKIEKHVKKITDYDKNCVLSVCSISGGTSSNIIPEKAFVTGTFRSFSQNSREDAKKAIETLAENIAEKYNTNVECEYNFLYPPVINDDKMTELMRNSLKRTIGEENIIELKKPLMTGEDFSYFANAVPSIFIWYGAGTEEKKVPLHSNMFNPDENAIKTAASVFCDFVCEYGKLFEIKA